jgi:rod shape-determining protein MreC
VALSLTLAAADHAGGTGAAVDGLREAVLGGLGQVDRAVTRPFSTVAAALGRADALTRENARLRRRVAVDRGRAEWADAIARDNAQLASLTGLSTPGALREIPARVVALPTGRPGSGLVLDRGTEAGIQPGMPVLAAGALVGRVVSASAGRAAVLPIVDSASTVGVRLADSGESGVVEGAGEGLRLQLLDGEVEASKGVLVVTAGLQHGRFPPALPVGHVRRGGRTVTPLADMSRLELVEILAWRPPG